MVLVCVYQEVMRCNGCLDVRYIHVSVIIIIIIIYIREYARAYSSRYYIHVYLLR